MELITRSDNEGLFPIQFERGYPHPHPRTVPWSIAELAYSQYASRHGTLQTLKRLSERGGFAPSEMDMFLPDWKERADENVRLRADLAAAIARSEEAERKLCAARELIGKANPNVSYGMWPKSAVVWSGSWTIPADLMKNIDAALSSSSPCRHEAEADALKEALRGIVQWADPCWTGGYAGDPKTPHPAWGDVQEGRAVLEAGKT